MALPLFLAKAMAAKGKGKGKGKAMDKTEKPMPKDMKKMPQKRGGKK
jgi:hypothetical protein